MFGFQTSVLRTVHLRRSVFHLGVVPVSLRFFLRAPQFPFFLGSSRFSMCFPPPLSRGDLYIIPHFSPIVKGFSEIFRRSLFCLVFSSFHVHFLSLSATLSFSVSDAATILNYPIPRLLYNITSYIFFAPLTVHPMYRNICITLLFLNAVITLYFIL